MGLMAMLEKALNGQDANANPAKDAKDSPKTAPTLATLATLALASSSKPKTEPPTLRLVHTSGERTEQEAALHAKRLQSFQSKGVSNDDAAILADRLAARDKQDDDRKSCAECASFHAGVCRQNITPIGETTIHTLHRCKGFKPNEENHDI